jgi:carbonic anhydrase
MIDQIIDYNKTFVAEKGYEKYITDKYPDKKLAVLSCMDTRLTELLPAALGLKNGDAKINPLVPKDIVVRGFIIDSETGALEEVCSNLANYKIE